MRNFNAHATSKIRTKLEKTGTLRWFHWLVVALSLGLTFFAWNLARKQQNERAALQFDREADQTVDLILERMAKYEEALWGGVAFLRTVDGNIDHDLWNRYAEALRIEQKYPGINGIGVIASLKGDQVDTFLRDQQTDRPSFAIHPPPNPDESFPILAISPLTGNEKAIGLDMAHETNRIATARKALATGTAQVTGPIVLVQDELQTPGFLFYAPFQANGPKQKSKSEFDGLVFAPFVFHELMEGVLDKTRRHVSIRIGDGSDKLYDELVDDEADFDADPLIKKQYSVDVYGRTWLFDVWSSKSFRESVDSTQANSILVGGLIINSMLVFLFSMISRGARKSLQFADTLTADLESFGLAARVNKIGVFDYDPKSGVLKWNDAMFDIYGQKSSGFVQSYASWATCVHPDDLPPTEEKLRASLAEGDSYESEFRVIHPDGTIRHLNAKGVIFRDAEGKASRLLGANTDITRRKLATDELAATQRMQAAIQEAAGVSMIATDTEGLILMYNTTAETMLGYTKEEIVLRETPALMHDPDEVVARAAELSVELGRVVEPGFEVFIAKAIMGESEQREWTYIRKDGSKVPVLLTVTAIRNDDNQISGFLGIAADITERKKAVLEIQNANNCLIRSNEELAQFAYVASHDLQEPLRKVTSFCELLKEDCGDQLNEDGLTYMSYIIDGAGRMRALIQDLLDYSRVDNDLRRTSEVDVQKTVSFAIDNLSEAITETEAEITFDHLPVIQAHPRQMAQLFENLIGNAIKYHGNEKPRVRIGGEVIDHRCRFWVEDNGIGIAPQYRDQIFGIFKRLHGQSEYKGTGIGLAVCKRIVDHLDGKIWVEESAMGGCRFQFEFMEPNSDEEVQTGDLELAAH
ncbi:Phytochrome-like protein cph1 [Roseimaritima multifibrata]|uniref:histidine kinase n=1 Tax=Roseimaritima multifibrata TaxID=1930274 RepID=A0A517MBB6_9BACT|nr:CHASE domain-containing protein [Roseimaritima multifibrata]QDS92164.1 Phytochrome-like protein cph1 [Roseimaritima multifibrata]